jgi:short-subunit dehydrogenase
MVQVNVTALAHLTQLFLPAMVATGRGRIMNVASVAGFLPGPLLAVYYASKAFVLSFSEALSSELEGTGVTVTAVCPGPTGTDFFNRANVTNSKLTAANLMTSQQVAKIGYDAMMAGRRLSVPGWKNRMLTIFIRFLPRGLVLKMAKRVNESR